LQFVIGSIRVNSIQTFLKAASRHRQENDFVGGRFHGIDAQSDGDCLHDFAIAP